MAELHEDYSTAEFRYVFGGETTSVEFKTGISSTAIPEAAVAMSNTDGGIVFIGLNDDGRILGKALDQGSLEKLNQALVATHDLGRYEIREIKVDGSPLIALVLHRRSEGFSQTSDGRVLVRRGPRNHSLMGTELHQFISSRALQRFESVPSSIRTSQANRTLLSELGEARGWDLDSPFLEKRLEERGLSRDGFLTIAGALTLTHPGQTLLLQKCVVEVRRYPREGVNYDRREVFDGPLHHQVRDASRFISTEIGTDIIISGVYRFDLPKLPEVVIREAIANAVAHRNYENDRAATIVDLRDDRVIVRSPGGLPEPVTIETIRAAQSARNPIVIDILRALSLAEDAGRGIDVMQDSMRDALLDAPEFSDDGSFVSVVLPLRGPITDRERGWVTELERSRGLEPSERLLMIHAARGEALTNATARELLGVPEPTEARRVLQHLRDKKLLTQKGARSSARYLLHPDLSAPAAYRMSQDELAELVVAEARQRDIVNADVREITGLETPAASVLLGRLVREGRLVRTGNRRGSRYSAS
jgi:ATP-dependent DNA helicase RecG